MEYGQVKTDRLKPIRFCMVWGVFLRKNTKKQGILDAGKPAGEGIKIYEN